MEPTKPRSRSRGSVPNLTTLNIGPLSTNPLEPSSPSPTGTTSPHTSYITHKSAPNTPNILSLSQSRSSSHHRRRNPKFAHAGSYFPTAPPSPTTSTPSIPQSQSASVLSATLDSHGRMHAPAPAPKTKPSHARTHSANIVSAGWLHRAGLAIASQTRDQKGQAWLVQRDSSTGLAALSPDAEHAASLDELLQNGMREHKSRAGSRAASALNSRRGSRVGSRAELGAWAGSGTITPVTGLDFAEPDFVDAKHEEDDDDGEEVVAKLTREQTLGLGGWVDRLVGWTLFKVAEDGEEDDLSDVEGQIEENEEVRRKILAMEAARRRKEREIINAASAKAAGMETETERKEDAQAEGGWQDAAWLLSVASKVLI